MDDWVVSTATRLKSRVAVRVVNQTLDALKVARPPIKPLSAGRRVALIFLGFYLTHAALMVAETTRH